MNKWLAKNVVYRALQVIREEPVMKYLSDIMEVPHYSPEKIKELQSEKLAAALKNAYNNIPYYRDLFDRHGIIVEQLKLPDDLCKIPILTKNVFQQNAALFINKIPNGRVSNETTSGTSGNPLTIPINRHKSAFIRAVMFRNYRWYDIDIGDKQSRFWGVPTENKLRLKEALKDLSVNRIRLSAFHIDDEGLSRFVKRLRRFKPKYFYGYPSLLYKFSKWLNQNRVVIHDLNLSAIITTGEVLYDFQREAIEMTFGCRVVNEYGTTETGVIAFECPEGRLHINSDHVFLESIKSDKVENFGSLIVTELNNDFNPLIRYRIGDLGAISDDSCRCGIGFPMLQNLSGREGNFIITPGNYCIYSAILSYTFKDGIKQFQGIQDKKNELVIKIVKDEDLTDLMLKNYKKRLSRTLGDDMKIIFEFVPHIELEKSGKLRYFISNIN